jgi:hypothetical protein
MTDLGSVCPFRRSGDHCPSTQAGIRVLQWRDVRTTVHRHVISWIEAMTKIEAAADWIRWCLDGSPIVGWGCTIPGSQQTLTCSSQGL